MFHTWENYNLPVDNILRFETSGVYPCASSRGWRTNEPVRIAVERTAEIPRTDEILPALSPAPDEPETGKEADVIQHFDTD